MSTESDSWSNIWQFLASSHSDKLFLKEGNGLIEFYVSIKYTHTYWFGKYPFIILLLIFQRYTFWCDIKFADANHFPSSQFIRAGGMTGIIPEGSVTVLFPFLYLYHIGDLIGFIILCVDLVKHATV